jgi:hypothetical protein
MSAKRKPQPEEQENLREELWIAPDIRRIMGGAAMETTFAPLQKEPLISRNRILDLADSALTSRSKRRRRTDPK